MKYSIQFSRACLFLSALLAATCCFCADTEQTVIAPEEAKEYLGKEVTVEMTVQLVTNAASLGCCFLDSEKDFTNPNDVVVFITSAGLQKFKTDRGIERPDVNFFLHKIRVTGTITQYKNKHEIRVDSPEQIKDVEGPIRVTATTVKNYVGKNIIVEFVVQASKELPNSECCFLNSEADVNSADNLTVFINATGLRKYKKDPATEKPADYFLHKKIQVTGTISQYKQRPDLKVISPDQIKVVEESNDN